MAARYEVLARIGSGGMGAIYEVAHTQLGKRFAMKTLSPELIGDREAMSRFRREAHIVASLRHPHIVDVVDWVALPDGSPAIVMELLAGEDLGSRIRKAGALGWHAIARVADPIMSALVVAHAAGVVHRDLKPENIFLARDPAGEVTPMLLDFGISKRWQSADHTVVTRDDRVIGTPAYMAPEQARGEHAAVGPASDIWAMGMLLYFMATGRHPFEAPSSVAVLNRILRGEPDRLEQHSRSAPAALCSLVARALVRDPARRIATMRALRDEFRDAVAEVVPGGLPAPLVFSDRDELTERSEPPVGADALTPRSPRRGTEVGCPPVDDLVRFAARELSVARCDAVEEHIDGCGGCRAALAEAVRCTIASPAAEPAPGTALPAMDRYVPLRALGEGGMGIVVLARDPQLRRNVALKVMRAARAGGADIAPARARLLREAQAMAQVSHPNVVAVYDVGVHDDQVFLAMEYVDGDNLADWLRAGGRTAGEVLAVFERAARGLIAAHDAGLVHRDFKPHNVMVGRGGEVKVTDFGLARAGVEAAGVTRDAVTRAGAFVGTPAYMAPEQMVGDPVDPRSDQFSFCVALYEALYGNRPFAGETPEQILAAAAAGAPRPPARGRAAAVSRRLREAIRRGLSIDPEQRLPSMRALVDAFSSRSPAAARVAWAGGATAIVAIAIASIVWGGDPIVAPERARGSAQPHPARIGVSARSSEHAATLEAAVPDEGTVAPPETASPAPVTVGAEPVARTAKPSPGRERPRRRSLPRIERVPDPDRPARIGDGLYRPRRRTGER